ncbi:MAG TPA: hypothetical protein VKR59_14150 [Terriglobales bacterium]|nr:hypothetical protein [Terriglobales bacterium]
MSNGTTGLAAFNAIQGRWTVLYQEIDGQVAGPVPTTLEIQGNEFKIEKDNDVNYEGTVSVGSGSPAEVVLIYRKSATPLFLGGPRAGIFQVEGDTLKWIFGAVGHPAPREFNTFPGSETVLSVYTRETLATKREDRVRRPGITKSAFASVVLW